MNEIEKYYNKFNEDKRLLTRHGQVEFFVTTNYINKYLKKLKKPKILDVGAGTGRYSIYLNDLGYDVTAVELVKHNLKVLEEKNKNIKAILANATNLKKIEDNSFDIVLLFGPLYHLFSLEDKIKAIEEAKRVVKNNGLIFIQYVMNDYAILVHGFREQTILNDLEKNRIDKNFKIKDDIQNLYSFYRIEDINELNKLTNLKRIKIIGVDGATDYFRKDINKLSFEEFELFKKYQLSICERKELMGASSHILDILRVKK